MDEGDGLSFDFEGGLDDAAPVVPSSATVPVGGRRRSFRQTVCRHWVQSLCKKGESCGFLHELDTSRMPVCRFFRSYGECRERDCPYKHANEDIKECNMYKLGFCPNGPHCRYRHAKLPGPPPPPVQILINFPPAQNNNAMMSRQGMPVRPMLQQQQQQQQPVIQTPQGISRYFIVKSCNRENLLVSVQQGVWATQRSNEAKLNEAFDSVENVILIFSVNRTRNFQGLAKMTSRIGGYVVGGGNWTYAHGNGTPHYGRNFSLKWLKLCDLSFHKTRHLKNPYNDNLPVKISRDCQELEPSIGEQLASLLYLEPDSAELVAAISVAAEAKGEEEKPKGGVNPKNENPLLEEESEEEEDEISNYAPFGALGSRGRGVGGFSPMMMMMMMGGGGMTPPDGFPMPDMFGMGGPRPFPPFGSRPPFPGHFSGGGRMMFPLGAGRPPQVGGMGMMMGPGPRSGAGGPFMGPRGGAGGGGGRGPMGIPRAPLARQRDQKIQSASGSDLLTNLETVEDERQQMYQRRAGSRARHEDEEEIESESEDEAPRRSRQGESKTKRPKEE